MMTAKQDIIARLQREILPLQGIKPVLNGYDIDLGLGLLKEAFPDNRFPLGAVHEFISNDLNDVASTAGFIAGLLSPLMQSGGACMWVSATRKIFPPALKFFDINPENVIFIDLHNEKDIFWAMEEALKCGALAAVIGEARDLSFTASRRLQLAVEQSHVTGFVIRQQPRNLNPTACVTRWKITSMVSETGNDLPGIGFPYWNVDLLKVRNGKPGSWQLKWENGRFRHIYKFVSMVPGEDSMSSEQKKTG